MTNDAESFPWSSCAARCGANDPLVSHHRAYRDLGNNVDERAMAYLAMLGEVLSEDTLRDTRTYLQQQRALGQDDFRAMVEARTQRFASTRPPHRPRKRRD